MQLIRVLIAAAVILIGSVPTAGAAAGDSSCTKLPRSPDGTHRVTFDAVDVTEQIAGLPPRVETGVEPGESSVICIGFQNRTGEPLSLELRAANVGADEQGLPSSGAEDADFGAASWLDLPTRQVRDLAHGELVWVPVRVQVPIDAVTGSSYAAVIAKAANPSATGAGSQVQSVPSIAIQLFFDVPGNASGSGRITDVRSPRVVWWDGLDLGGLPVLESLRGQGIAPIRFDWKNDGDLTSLVGGHVVIRSDVSGRQVARLKVKDRSVLRGSERTLDVTWSQDIPFVGRFTPTLEVTSSDGERTTRKLDPIWVIPSWWYLLGVVLALGIPLAMRRRSARRYGDLVARLEAAEGRSDADAEYEDDDWDDPSRPGT